MASSYDNDLRLNEMATGDQSGAWGTVTNLNLEIIAEAFGYGTRAIANASTDNITIADGALDADRSMYLKLTGGGQACTVSLLPNTVSKVWLIENATSYTLTFTQGSGANVAVLAGQVKMIATDGAGSGAVVYDLLTDVNLAGTTVMGDIAVGGKVITMTGSSGDTATLTVAADGALAIATTDAAAAAANISITADGTFTATGTTITLDSAGDIILDADGADVIFKDGGTSIGTITNASSDLVIKSNVQDKDILLKGDDGGTEITALSLDMSAGGNALFSGTVTRDLTRGSLDVGNSSGVSAPLAAGGADTVLTSNGTDISWAAAGGAFAGATVTVTANTTLSAAQNGNLVNIAATNEKVISLPAAAAGAFYIFNNDTSHIMYIKPNGSNTINGVIAALSLAPEASGILACGGSTTNWSSVGLTRSLIVAKATTFTNNTVDQGDANQITGTYTPILGSSMLICVGSSTAGANHVGTSGNNYYYRSGAPGGSSYAEKFIASPASSYAYTISGAGSSSKNNNDAATKTTIVAGMTCTRGPGPQSQSSTTANVPGRTGGTATGGTVNFTGGTGATPSATGNTGRNTGGGGAATRAGNGGNGALNAGGGTGGNNASQDTAGAAATAKSSNSYAVPNTTSETYQAGTAFNTTGTVDNRDPLGASPNTFVNIGSANFEIADGIFGSRGGAGGGGYSRQGRGGYITFVEFF